MYVTMQIDAQPGKTALTPALGKRNAVPLSLKENAYLYYEGDEVTRLFQVVTGVVRLTRLLVDGRRQVIAFGYPGDVIGFPAEGQHHADCDALVDTTLWSFNRSALEHGDGDPDLHEALLRAALREISAMQDHFMMLGRKSATEKVASFLSVITDRYGEGLQAHRRITLPMARSDIADFLGLTTETVSRTFTMLRKANIIALDGVQTVVVLDPQALRDMT